MKIGDTAVKSARIEIWIGPGGERFANLTLIGTLPRCRKPAALSHYGADPIHLRPLYGHARGDNITFAEWVAFIGATPVVLARTSCECIDLSGDVCDWARRRVLCLP